MGNYRITRKIREENVAELKLPFSSKVSPVARHQIEQKAMLDRFPMTRVLKWLADDDDVSEILDRDDVKLYPIIDDNKYSVVLEGNLRSEYLLLRIRKNEMSSEDLDDFLENFDIGDEDEPIEELVIQNEENSSTFADILDWFVEKSLFIPTIIYLDDDHNEDIYWKSCIRKLVILRLSLQYKVIKMIVEDILDFDDSHVDANKLKEDQIDGVVNLDYPPQDDVYYFITWSGEKYRLRRDMELSPRMDDTRRKVQKSRKRNKYNNNEASDAIDEHEVEDSYESEDSDE